jgi:hypothetical protein
MSILLLFFVTSITATCPNQVTCSIVVFQRLISLYVNEIDITDRIQGNLNNYSIPKTVTFTQPSTHNAAFAIKAFENLEIPVGTLQVQCTSVSPEWTFNTDITQWKALRSSTTRTDALPSDWFKNNRSGPTNLFSSSTQKLAWMNNSATILKASQGNPPAAFWVFRRDITNSQPCGTNSPSQSVAPSFLPSMAPIPKPTLTPTPKPSITPSILPSFAPTNKVDCCLTCMNQLLDVYVDEKKILVNGDPSNASVSKFFTFTEPLLNASISFSFYHYNEIFSPRAKLSCATTNPMSPWNFVMDDTFRSIKSNDAIFSSTPDWRFNNLSESVALNPKILCSWRGVNNCANTTVCMDRGVPPRKYFAMYKKIIGM